MEEFGKLLGVENFLQVGKRSNKIFYIWNWILLKFWHAKEGVINMNCTEKEGILKKILYQVIEMAILARFFIFFNLFFLSNFQFCLKGFTFF